jgi:hypothetical protein
MPRRSLSERATTRYLRLALRRGDASEAPAPKAKKGTKTPRKA